MVFTKDKKVTKDEMEDISWKPSGDDIEFAVYGKQVIREGKIVEINRITGEFSDLRHLFRMPNLNPNDKLYIDDSGYPRYYFGKNQNDNVWFGEAELLEHPNEQRAACCGPIFLSRLYRGMGASVEQIRGAMGKEGYKEINDTREPLKEGEFRFVQDDDSLVEVYFSRNKYGWTMIGLSKYGILCLASQGNPKEGIGYKLEDAAKELIDIGANSALLIDEGDDVFQIAKVGHEDKPKIRTYESGELDIFIPSSKKKVDDKNRYITVLKRNRLRATFIFAKKKDENDGNKGDSPVQKDEQNRNDDTGTIAVSDQK
jgi:hypothetical protein